MTDLQRLWLLRLCGIAGVIGAILWIIGDALIIGAKASQDDYPLILKTYSDRIQFDGVALMLPSSEARLAAGALVADVGIVFYLAGCWHLLEGLRPAQGGWRWPAFALLVAGNAWSPLGHAGFYYVGMVYKTILETPTAAHDALLDLGQHFHNVLVIAWLMPIVTLGLALLLLGIVIALGRTSWPRWFALIANPISLIAVGMLIARVLPEPAQTALDGAVFNLGWLVVYGLSTVLLWNGRRSVLVQGPSRE
ncbi:MAG: hypothetical protein H2055_10615 [Sphingopyxis sp.]|nr:hypothetical protein [Sphingopyxis sp.]